jgi:lactate racemase
MTRISIEYGGSVLQVNLPFKVDIAGMSDSPEVLDPGKAYQEAMSCPMGTRPLLEIAMEKIQERINPIAVILVSDNTRPTPYRGNTGMMVYILRVLLQAGFREDHIYVLIGNGSHREMTEDEIEKMLGLKQSGYEKVNVVNHRYDREDELVYIGETRRGGRALINKLYAQADLKIVTGLIESHFMAGASGGPKGICPAIVSKETLQTFHGAQLLSSEFATDLEIHKNPVQLESTEVASMIGCDFLVNVTLDSNKQLTGVFAGDMISAHRKGVDFVMSYVSFPVEKKYDVVVIPGGFVGINHYQTAKAAVIASRVVKEGGFIIIVARNTDLNPIGGPGYLQVLKHLKETGIDSFMKEIMSPEWNFVQEQWQVQLWCKAYQKIGSFDHLIYCATEIPEDSYRDLPVLPGVKLAPGLTIEEMMEKSIVHAFKTCKSKDLDVPSVILLKDGPYGVPVSASAF